MDADFGPVNWNGKTHHILLNPRWPGDDLVFLQRKARGLLAENAVEPCVAVSSSGSSAGTWREVKILLIPKRAFLIGAESVAARFSLNRKDRFGQVLPEFHVGGLGVRARAHVTGARVIDLRESSGWIAADFHRLAGEHQVTVVSLVPTQLHDLVARKLTPWKSLRTVFIGAGFLDAGIEAAARAAGWPLVVTYGMTETAAMIATRAEPDPALGFLPLPHVRVAVPNERIEIRTEALAVGVTGRDGWFISEDRGEFRDGRLFVFGRGTDRLKINGENVDLVELRRLFRAEAEKRGLLSTSFHLAARPDARSGHRLVLYVQEGCDFAQARAAFDAKVLPFERIREMVELPEIPRTELGKVREAALPGMKGG